MYRYYIEDAYGNVNDVTLSKGGYYIFYKVENSRSINPKTKRKADELLIVGVPFDKMKEYCHYHKVNLCRELV